MLQTRPGPELIPPLPLRPAAPVPDDLPPVHVGSRFDAKQLRGRIQALLVAVGRADEQVRLLCQQARDRKIFMVLEDPSGKYFDSWSAFVTAPVPWGLGMPTDVIEALVKEHRDPKRQARLVLEGPQLLQSRNAPRKGRQAGPAAARGTPYTLQRLRRDRVDLLERVASGELTIQAAAELAGHRPPFTGVLVEPQAIARLIVSRLEPPQQQEVVHLVLHPQEITDPGHGQKSAYWEAYRQRTTPPEVLAQERAQAAAEKRAAKLASLVAYNKVRNAVRGEQRAAQRAQAAALGLPSLAAAGALVEDAAG